MNFPTEYLPIIHRLVEHIKFDRGGLVKIVVPPIVPGSTIHTKLDQSLCTDMNIVNVAKYFFNDVKFKSFMDEYIPLSNKFYDQINIIENARLESIKSLRMEYDKLALPEMNKHKEYSVLETSIKTHEKLCKDLVTDKSVDVSVSALVTEIILEKSKKLNILKQEISELPVLRDISVKMSDINGSEFNKMDDLRELSMPPKIDLLYKYFNTPM